MRSSERSVQRAVIAYLAAAVPGCVVAHVPNGGSRDAREAVNLRNDGVRAGFPDLVLCLPGGVTALWEIKSPSGRASMSQVAIHAALRGLGHQVSVIRSVDDAARELRALGIRPRARVAA